MTAAAERPLRRGMRALLVVAGVLVLLAGTQLFVFPLRTGEWFAWTIASPMTAVFLGAAYWSAAVVEWSAARRRTWAHARAAVPAVLLFTTLTLVVTLVHLDRFHLGAEHGVATRAVTWAWLAIYVGVPVLMAVLWWRQARTPGVDPPRGRPLPTPVRLAATVQALVLLPLGTALLLVPLAAAPLWPWALTPLTGRAIGAWLVSLGVAAVHSLREDDVERVVPTAAGALAFLALETLALLRHGAELTGGTPTVGYLVVLASFALTGSPALLRRRRPAQVPGTVETRSRTGSPRKAP